MKLPNMRIHHHHTLSKLLKRQLPWTSFTEPTLPMSAQKRRRSQSSTATGAHRSKILKALDELQDTASEEAPIVTGTEELSVVPSGISTGDNKNGSKDTRGHTRVGSEESDVVPPAVTHSSPDKIFSQVAG